MTLLLKILPYIGAAVLAAAAIIVLRKVFKRRKENRQLREMSYLQRRNDALSEALRNPQNADGPAAGPKGPIQISWDDKTADSEKEKGALMIELTEIFAHARRKYVFHLSEAVFIGSGENCHMVIAQEDVSPVHCGIFMAGRRPCLRSESDARTVLKRGKNLTLVSQKGVYLNNNDQIQLGKVKIDVKLFKG